MKKSVLAIIVLVALLASINVLAPPPYVPEYIQVKMNIPDQGWMNETSTMIFLSEDMKLISYTGSRFKPDDNDERFTNTIFLDDIGQEMFVVVVNTSKVYAVGLVVFDDVEQVVFFDMTNHDNYFNLTITYDGLPDGVGRVLGGEPGNQVAFIGNTFYLFDEIDGIPFKSSSFLFPETIYVNSTKYELDSIQVDICDVEHSVNGNNLTLTVVNSKNCHVVVKYNKHVETKTCPPCEEQNNENTSNNTTTIYIIGGITLASVAGIGYYLSKKFMSGIKVSDNDWVVEQ